jgi:adenylate cyclase
MTTTYQVHVYHNNQLKFSGTFDKAVEIGRQDPDRDPLAADKDRSAVISRDQGAFVRLVVARKDEREISRYHVRLEPLADGKVRVTNISTAAALKLDDAELNANAPPVVRQMPVSFPLGSRLIQVREAEAPDRGLESLAASTRAPGGPLDVPSRQYTLSLAGNQVGIEEMVRWFQAAMDVLQSAASSTLFFQKASRATVDLVGLTSSQVLLLEGETWKPVAWHPAGGSAPDHAASKRVLASVRDERKTFYQARRRAEDGSDSLLKVRAVVASPILDAQERVIGALYGDRQVDDDSRPTPPLTKLDAMLMDLLAVGVAAGLARAEHERAAVAARVRFEEFFTPELARHLAANPELLKGSDAEVTVLFCDVRRFSHFSEKLGPETTMKWIGEVMEASSDCVRAERGVLVDYSGDELMAMWGAPEKQPDHAARACRAALAIGDRLPQLNGHWQPVLGEPMELGIGLNTGVARVGNTGSRHKFKYGPLGNTVNLASRVQGATKFLNLRLLATGATYTAAGAGCAARRIGKVLVNNITAPVELYELGDGADPSWASLKARYEQALAEFERGDYAPAARDLANLLIDHPDDGPALVLLSRAVPALSRGAEQSAAVWELPGK